MVSNSLPHPFSYQFPHAIPPYHTHLSTWQPHPALSHHTQFLHGGPPILFAQAHPHKCIISSSYPLIISSKLYGVGALDPQGPSMQISAAQQIVRGRIGQTHTPSSARSCLRVPIDSVTPSLRLRPRPYTLARVDYITSALSAPSGMISSPFGSATRSRGHDAGMLMIPATSPPRRFASRSFCGGVEEDVLRLRSRGDTMLWGDTERGLGVDASREGALSKSKGAQSGKAEIGGSVKQMRVGRARLGH